MKAVNVPGPLSSRVTGAGYTGVETNTALVTVDDNHHYVCTGFTVMSNAGSDDAIVVIGFGSSTIVDTLFSGTLVAIEKFGFGDGSGILHIGDAGEDLRVTVGDPGSGAIIIIVFGYQIPKQSI